MFHFVPSFFVMETQNLYSLIFASILLLLFVLTIFKKTKSTLVLPPGPWKLPIIGNLHQLAGKIPHRIFTDLAKQYGPIIHVKLGQTSVVVVSSTQLAREVLKTLDLAFCDRPLPLAFGIVSYGGKDVGFAPYGGYWRQMKRICTLELLSPKKVQSFAYIREEESFRLVDSIRSSLGKPINLSVKLLGMINSIVCRETLGNNFDEQDKLIELVKDTLSLSGGWLHLEDLFPKLEFLHALSGLKTTLLKMHKMVDKIFDNIFEKHKVDRSKGYTGEKYLIDVLMRLKEEGRHEFPIATESIKAVIMDMFIAGTDSSSAVIEWTMVELMRNPRVMKKVQEEVRRAFNRKKTVDESVLEDLPYMKLAIKEALRLHPTGALLLPRECREQCKINGYDIPVKTRVLVNAWAISRDTDYWEDAESFKPERFKGSSVDLDGSHFEFIPFGAGRRKCPGMPLGLANTEFPLAQLLYHFDWHMPDGMKPEDIDMSEAIALNSVKKIPLCLIPSSYSGGD